MTPHAALSAGPALDIACDKRCRRAELQRPPPVVTHAQQIAVAQHAQLECAGVNIPPKDVMAGQCSKGAGGRFVNAQATLAACPG